MIKLQTLEPNEVAVIMPRVQDELNARYFYEAASAWCLTNGYDNAAKYYEHEATQENEHYARWIKFLSDWNVVIDFPEIPQPPKFTSLLDIIEKANELEYNLEEAYEQDAVNVFPICQIIYKLMQEYVHIQSDSVIEANNIATKAYNYIGIDPNLVLFESEVFG
jgi:ferritin